MSIFSIKIIACIAMFLDHIKFAIPAMENNITIYIGRMAFPLFAFFTTEAYIHTKSLKKYYFRLFVFAIISQIPFMLFRTLVGEWKMLNIIFTLLLGLTAILIYDKGEDKFISLVLVGCIAYFGYILRVDYGWYGILSVFIIYLFKNKKVLLVIAYSILLAIYYKIRDMDLLIIENLKYFVCSLIPIFLICLYNGKLGKKAKYFFYIFYPVHMLIVYFIGTYINIS